MRAADKAASLIRQVSAQQVVDMQAQQQQQYQQQQTQTTRDHVAAVAEAVAADLSSGEQPRSKVSLLSLLLSTAALHIVEVRLAVLMQIRSSSIDNADKHTAKLLRSARNDLANLQTVSRSLPSFVASLHRLRAVVRALAGGSASRTVVLFDKALSLARQARYETMF